MGAVAVAAAGTALRVHAAEGHYPIKPISYVIGYAPGGNSDYTARSLSALLTARLGQSVVVENRPGAGGVVATDFVAKSPSDGYIIGHFSNSFFTVTPALIKVPYDPARDFEPIAFIGTNVNVLAVHPALPIHTLPEFLAYAKAHPGELNYGSSGGATGNHISTEYMKRATGIDVVHVPFRGSGPAIQELIAGRIQFVVDSGLMTHARAGTLRLIAIFDGRRGSVNGFPDLPPISELVPNWNPPTWYNFAAVPAHTPAYITQKLSSAFASALADKDLIARLRVNAYDVTPITPAELRARLAAEYVSMRKLLTTANIHIS
jgi:tripartite-type tricarboxylate transporter receptor subunit TctC